MSKKHFFIAVCFVIHFAGVSAHASQEPEESRGIRYPAHPIHSIYAYPWRFLEQVFVIEPQEEIHQIIPQVIKIMATMIGATPGCLWCMHGAIPSINQLCTAIYYGEGEQAYEALSKSLFINGVGSLALAISLAYISYATTHYLFETYAELSAFKNFVVKWPHNKEKTPPILHELFDFVNKEYVASASEEYLTQVTPDVVSRVKKIIYEHFPTKYQDKLSYEKTVPTWLKWTLVTLGTATIVKLITSAVSDVMGIAHHRPPTPPVQPVQPVLHVVPIQDDNPNGGGADDDEIIDLSYHKRE